MNSEIGNKMDIFYSDLIDCAYILCNTLITRNEKEISKTRFYKTISNLLIDQKVRRYMIWEPHPFGAVPIIPAKDGVRFRHDSYLDSESTVEYGLWEYVKNGRRGNFSMTNSQKDGVERKLPDSARQYLLNGYATIYSKLDTSHLNHLATCRNEKCAFQCANYEEDLWAQRISRIFASLLRDFDNYGHPLTDKNINNFKKDLVDTAIVAKQINIKVELFQKNESLLAEINKCKDKTTDILIKSIVKSIEIIELTDRLNRLQSRGLIARQITVLVRLLCACFGIKEEPELAKIDPIGDQLNLFTDYSKSIYDNSIKLGKILHIHRRNIVAKNLMQIVTTGQFRKAAETIRDEYFLKHLKIINKEPSKQEGYVRSKFTVIDNLSFLDFSLEN